MKKIVLLLLVLSSFALTGCGKNSGNVIIVSATAVPHAEILEEARPILKQLGYELDVVVVSSYYVSNPAVASGSADANFFQHIPFFDEYNSGVTEDKKLANVATIHIEPIGLYSPVKYGYTNVSDIKNGDTILMSNSTGDLGRLLKLLEAQGLITLKAGAGITATVDDIIANPKNLIIKNDVAPELLVSAYNYGEAPIVLINSNFALAAGINPLTTAIALESTLNNPYANIVACRTADVDTPKIKALIEALTSQTIKDFITSEYTGAVIPA